jgi:AcrR family transcriptional regulator
LSRELIVEAAHEIGFENLTMKTVADHLGVSVPGLYHYVQGKDDLLRLAAEFSAGRMELPKDHGQHWAVWLYEWAMYNRNVFIAEPGLLKQFIEGAIGADRTGDRVDVAMGTLVKQGFSAHDARLVYQLISELAIGAAVGAIRERQAAADGRPSLAEYHRVLAMRDPDDLPHLRAMVADATANPTPGFHEALTTVLRGIAAERNEKWGPIEAKLRRFVG